MNGNLVSFYYQSKLEQPERLDELSYMYLNATLNLIFKHFRANHNRNPQVFIDIYL